MTPCNLSVVVLAPHQFSYWSSLSRVVDKLYLTFASNLQLRPCHKVGRMAYEAKKSTDLQVVGVSVKEAFEQFAKDTGRKLQVWTAGY